MFGLLKKAKKEKLNNDINFDNMSFKEKIEYLLKSISENNYEYEDRLELVNKMTDWFQTRYPDEYIAAFFEKSNEVDTINDFVFKNTKKPDMDWNDIYNTKVFLNLLEPRLKQYLDRPKYKKNIFAGKYSTEVMDISGNGIIMFANIFYEYEGKHIKVLYSDIINNKITNEYINKCQGLNEDEEYNVKIIEDLKSQILKATCEYEQAVKAKNVMFDAVMYNLMNYWNFQNGCCRALLFAEEFKRNIDLPLIYGLGYDKNQNRAFVNYYLMLGGNPDLMCYEDYDRAKFDKISLKEFMKYNDNYSKYEYEMYERIVSVLKNSLPSDIEKIKAKQKRIERRLNKY